MKGGCYALANAGLNFRDNGLSGWPFRFESVEVPGGPQLI